MIRGMTAPRIVEVEILSETPNHVVLRSPGRRFPGSLIQGDSLNVLLTLARSVRAHARASGDATWRDDAEELHELLQARLLHYQDVLRAAGSLLPWGAPIAEDP